jgi:hypothetical protein
MNGFVGYLMTLLQLRVYNVRTGPETNPMGTGIFSLYLNRQGREGDHSSPSSAEVKNGGPIPPPHTPSLRADWLIKHTNIFIFLTSTEDITT